MSQKKLQASDIFVRKARILWSYGSRKPTRTYTNILNTLKMSIDTKAPLAFLQILNEIEYGLGFFYEWLETPLNFIPKADAPNEVLTIFEKSAIIHYLWNVGEDWNNISKLLYGSFDYATKICNYVAKSNIYDSPDDYSVLEADVLAINSAHAFAPLKAHLLSLSFDESVNFSLHCIDRNVSLAPLIVSTLIARIDFDAKNLIKYIKGNKEPNTLCLMQWMLSMKAIRRDKLGDLHSDFYFSFIQDANEHSEPKMKDSVVSTGISIYLLKNATRCVDRGTQSESSNEPNQRILEQLKKESSMLYYLITNESRTLSVVEHEKFIAFAMNIYFLSPQMYKVFGILIDFLLLSMMD